MEVAEGEAGTDTMAEVEDGTGPVAAEDAAATLGQGGRHAGADTMAEVEDGTAPAVAEDAAATPEAGATEDEAGTGTMAPMTAPRPLLRKMRRLRLMWR